MGRNTGKDSEASFRELFRSYGKDAFLHRLTDASDIYGMTGEAANADSQPSDFIVVCRGQTYFAEVKSTQNKTSFPFSLLRPTQSAHALQITKAGGGYQIFVLSIALGKWFVVPYDTIQVVKAQGRASLKWGEMNCWTL
jgi:penicillin-binding protein-related factor A (putative recombinase)